ncbi:thioredoxin [Pseudarthrobacter sp. GA104]|uniref:thioredoxin n=1 Tax=Pseudarthrobacter sp. GA104 TaxID=2676311 RepID=UPI0012F882E2|nr:thioredoxin [Pseudarthrobacter sp. GA104]MUU71844.1 thioredoxin [Pseudarthrobacter sp. GA104]
MATIDVTEQSFAETLENNDIVFVDFWAAWCGPCRMFAPTYGAAADRHPDITFAKVDTEAERSLAAAANITSIPTLMAFKDRTLVFSQPGALNATGLEEVIQEVRKLDTDKLRADAARQLA